MVKKLAAVAGTSLVAIMLALSGCNPGSPDQTSPPDGPDARLNQIRHIVVIFQENRSFDHLFGRFPGANGIDAASSESIAQLDLDNVPYTVLPQVRNLRGQPDRRFPADLPVAPFHLTRFAPQAPVLEGLADPVHRFHENITQINGGRMNKFVAVAEEANGTGGLVMGYYDVDHLPLVQLAREFTLCDNFFQSAFGGSLINHFFLIAAAPLYWPEAAEVAPELVVQLDEAGRLVKNGAVTPDGWIVNNISEFDPTWTPEKGYPPPQTLPTIGDRLHERGITWKWYAQFWDVAPLTGPRPLIPALRAAYHIAQPFTYFANYAPGTAARREHLVDLLEFERDLRAGTLPAVSFIKFVFPFDEHPGLSPLFAGQQQVADTVEAIQRSSAWESTLIIITYDEYGGWWDHVAPPARDRFGPGPRIPAVIVSPFAKRGFVDHSLYETISILRFIELRFGLEPLNERDAAAGDLLNALQLD